MTVDVCNQNIVWIQNEMQAAEITFGYNIK